ncbi:hypothetical protein ACROYT_G009784 [Oculina patagonica]
MSAESSSPKRGFGGIFHKKTDKRDGKKSAQEKKEKKEKKKHKRQPSIASTKAWRLVNCGELSEVDGEKISSEVRAPNEKEKPKNLRRRLPFGKAKPPKKNENSTEDKGDILLEDPASHSNEGEQSSERKDEKEIGQQKVSEYESGPVDETGESWVVLTPTDHAVSPDFTSKVFFETKETESSIPAKTCPTEDDNSVKTIIPKPESPPEGPKGEKIVSSTAILWEAFTHLKGLVLNNEKLVHVDTESSSSRYEICLYAYDFSLAKVVALWSFLLTRASEASKQILVYCISPLIRKVSAVLQSSVKEEETAKK